MKRYRVSKEAERDLLEIFVYWAERASVDIADRLIDSLTERFWLLGEHPAAGIKRTDIATDVRSFAAGKYVIYYRKTRRAVEILHVFHGMQDHVQAWRKKAD